MSSVSQKKQSTYVQAARRKSPIRFSRPGPGKRRLHFSDSVSSCFYPGQADLLHDPLNRLEGKMATPEYGTNGNGYNSEVLDENDLQLIRNMQQHQAKSSQ